MRLYAVKTGLVKTADNLIEAVLRSLEKQRLQIEDNDILALTSKIVSYSQGRVVKLKGVKPSEKAQDLAERYSLKPEFAELILREADRICGGVEKAVLTLKSGILTANAGIDSKNAPMDSVVLWPEDVVKWARDFRMNVRRKICKSVGVIVVDSGLIPLRIGTVGLALAVAGFKPIKECRGEKDLYGKRIIMTRHAVADDLASAAHLLMGETDEKIPIVLIRDAPVDFCEGAYGSGKMMMPFKECIFMNTTVVDEVSGS